MEWLLVGNPGGSLGRIFYPVVRCDGGIDCNGSHFSPLPRPGPGRVHPLFMQKVRRAGLRTMRITFQVSARFHFPARRWAFHLRRPVAHRVSGLQQPEMQGASVMGFGGSPGRSGGGGDGSPKV